MPAGKSGTTYSPWLVLVTVRDNAVPGLVAVTWASATTAPDWSLTTPRIVPLVTAVCEYAGTASNNVAAQVARNRYPNRFIFLLSHFPANIGAACVLGEAALRLFVSQVLSDSAETNFISKESTLALHQSRDGDIKH